MPMPKKERFRQALILSAGGAIIASGATAPATVDASHQSNDKQVQNAQASHNVEKSKAKRPPNG